MLLEKKLHDTISQVTNLRHTGHVTEAIKLFEQLSQAGVTEPKLFEELGLAYVSQKQYKNAVRTFARWAEVDPTNVAAHQNHAVALRYDFCYEDAEAACKRALDLKPDDVGFLSEMAMFSVMKGDKEATRLYADRIASAGKRTPSQTINLYIQYKDYLSDPDCLDDELDKLRRKMNQLTNDEKIVLNYALAQKNKLEGNLEREIEYYKAAGKLKKKQTSYSLDDELQQMKDIKSYFDKDFMDKMAQYAKDAPDFDQEVIWVLALPRSGTTLLEQVLGSHPKIKAIGEDSGMYGTACRSMDYGVQNGIEFPFKGDHTKDIKKMPSPPLIGKVYADYAVEKYGDHPFYVNKALSNIMLAGLIKLCFPKSKFMHLTRDPMDCCLSMFGHHFINDSYLYSYDMEDLAKYHNATEELIDHWKTLFGDDILTMKYEDIVDDFKPNVTKILDLYGLEWVDACEKFYENESYVFTASMAQVRNPLNKKGIGKWKAYESYLEPLKEALNKA